MKARSMELVWIVVSDLNAAVKFYTEIVGLELEVIHEEFGWAELKGQGEGARLGIAKVCDSEKIKPGHNAIPTFTVENIEQALSQLQEKGVQCLGKIQEVPGDVRLQMVVDLDGNHFQLVEKVGKF